MVLTMGGYNVTRTTVQLRNAVRTAPQLMEQSEQRDAVQTYCLEEAKAFFGTTAVQQVKERIERAHCTDDGWVLNPHAVY